MRDPTRLILVRHAEPSEEALRRIYGRIDVELSPAGHERAARIATMLAGVEVRCVYASPLQRAVETARPIAAAHGLEPVTLAGLRELDFGELEDLTLAEVGERYPGLLTWTEAPAAVAFPGGESVAAARARSLAATREIVGRHPEETVVAVAHAVVIRAILAEALGMNDDALFRLDQAFGGISVIDWFGESPLVRVVNAGAI